MPSPTVSVNSRGAGKQSVAELEMRILAYRRLAATRHLSQREWRALDRLRRHHDKRLKEGGI
jgi:hypothetical protein